MNGTKNEGSQIPVFEIDLRASKSCANFETVWICHMRHLGFGIDLGDNDRRTEFDDKDALPKWEIPTNINFYKNSVHDKVQNELFQITERNKRILYQLFTHIVLSGVNFD